MGVQLKKKDNISMKLDKYTKEERTALKYSASVWDKGIKKKKKKVRKGTVIGKPGKNVGLSQKAIQGETQGGSVVSNSR